MTCPDGNSARENSSTVSASSERSSNNGRNLVFPRVRGDFEYQRMKSLTGSKNDDFRLPFFLTTISVTQLISPNTSSSTQRTRWPIRPPICTKIDSEPDRRSHTTI